jgi:TM2 domain-containing membrane protein YozV
MSRSDTFHLRWRGKIIGPLTWPEIERKLDAHEAGLLHDLQYNNDWTTLGEYLALRGEIMRVAPNASAAPAPTAANLKPAPTVPVTAATSTSRPRHRWIFVALGLLLGFFGAHDFYAGHWIRGAVLLIAALVLWRLDWGIVLPWLWAIGEIILTKFDGKGRRMPWKPRPPKSP